MNRSLLLFLLALSLLFVLPGCVRERPGDDDDAAEDNAFPKASPLDPVS
jgi:hypothetical protein